MKNKKVFSIFHIWLLIPAVPFFAQVLLNARNIPKEDDYDAVLGWLINFKKAEGWDKIWLLFVQHNEHRLLHSRIIYVLYDWICGGVNFRSLIIIGDMQVLGAAIILCYFSLKYLGKYRETIAFVWMIILFDGCTYENSIWAMTAIANYGVIFLFLLSMFFYDRKKWWPGAVVQTILIFSNGNGMIGAVALCGFAYRKSKKAFIVCVAITIVCIVLYFVDYHKPFQVLPLPEQFPINPSKAIDFFMQEVGTYWSFTSAFIIGFLILVALLYFFPRKQMAKYWVWICMLPFIFGSMATVAVLRGSAIGAKYEQSRYLMYPEMLTAILVLFIYSKIEYKKGGRLIIALMLILILRNYALNYKQDKEKVAESSWYLEVRRYSWPWDKRHADSIAVESCQLGIYCIEDNR